MIKIFDEFLIGKRERMSWIVETGWATGGTMSSGEIVGINCTIEPDWARGWQENLTSGADNRNVQGRKIGPKTLPYTMSFAPTNWVWLKYLMDVSDGDDSGVKTHTFTMRNSILSYKLEWAKRHTTPHVLTIIGNAVKSATISFSKASGGGTDGLLSVALSCVGQDMTENSTVTSLSNITEDPFQYRNVKWVLGGTEIKEVNNGEININNGIDENDSRYCNNTYDDLLGEPIPKIFRITGRFNVNIKDKTMFDYWDAGIVVAGTNTLLFDRDGTGDDQSLITFGDFYVLGSIASTNLEGVTNVDVVWACDAFASIVSRDSIITY